MFIIGLALSIGGLAGFITMWMRVKDMNMHTYAFNQSNIETATIAFIIAFFAGVILTVFGIIKSKNKNYLDKMINNQKNSSDNAVCKRCGINLAPDCYRCPNCGYEVNNQQNMRRNV